MTNDYRLMNICEMLCKKEFATVHQNILKYAL